MNGFPYLAAGFVLTWGTLAAYAWHLEVRLSRARERLDRAARREEGTGSRGQGNGGAGAGPSGEGEAGAEAGA